METKIENGALTFFVWADMHFGYEQKFGPEDIRWQTLQQMGLLPGRPYPSEIGGVVEEPAFILACGDFVNGGGDGEKVLAYYLNALRQTDLRSFEVMGNHDIVYPNVVQYFAGKYGNRYYSFDQKGVHFVVLYQEFDQAEAVLPLEDKQIEWLAADLAALDPEAPVILLAHDRLDKHANAEKIYKVISKANILLLLSGHTHGRRLSDGIGPNGLHYYRWQGITGAVAGHVRNHPIDMVYGRTFFVVRVIPGEVAVVPWRWDLQGWARGQGWGGDCPEHVIISR